MSGDAPPPTGIIPRLTLFIEVMKREMSRGIDWRWRRGTLGSLGLLAGSLWSYLSCTLRRLTALHARFAAGKLPATPRRRATPRPAADGPAQARRPPGIPRGPVFLEYGLGFAAGQLRTLLDDPEMRALLAAAPQAGRLLRLLWRRITTDPLPELLQLPRKPREPRRAKPPRLARPKPARAALPEPPPEAPARWEPTPCLPPWPPPLLRA